MKKMTKRALSLLLTLAMILSLGVLPASAAGIDEAEEIDAAAYPAQQFSYYEPGGLNIDVKAPAGALPRGTTMEVSRLANLLPVQDAVDRAEDLDGNVVLAADISFWHEGEEVEPVDGNKILVTMTAPEIAEVLDPVVVHVPDEEPAVAERIDPIVDESLDIVAMGDQISFEAEKFSVYAVIGGGQTGDEARLNVVFHGATDTTILVKKADTTSSDYNKILYDPGAGTLPEGQLFRGWTLEENYTADTEPMNIAAIRTEVTKYFNEHEVKEGEVFHVYALLFNAYTVTYMDGDEVSLGSETVLVPTTQASAEYTVNHAYTPKDGEHNFEGWLVADGGSNIADHVSGKLYPNGTTVTLSGDVVFSVSAPAGSWLVFHENKGTYVAAKFIKSGEVTEEPTIEMKRRGYSFGGWYADEALTEEFHFGSTIDERTHVYAKWNSETTANYTVILWKQNLAGDDYDFWESKTIENATVGSPINIANTNTSATVGGETYSETGFVFEKYNTGKTVAPEGNTVVNVYFKRITVTLHFFKFNATGGYTQKNSGDYGNTMYGLFTTTGYPSNYGSQYIKIFKLTDGNWGYPTDGTYSNYYGEYKYVEGGQYLVQYDGNRYIRNGSWSEITSYQTSGLYGSSLADNDFTWPTDYDWYDNHYDGGAVSGTRTTFLDAFLPTDGSATVNFYGVEPAGTHVINFYKQNASGTGYDLANTVTASGTNFYISDKYNGYEAFEYSADGGERTSVGTKDAASGYYNGGETVSFTDTLSVYFNRKVYNIQYMDGAYVDGNGNPITGADVIGELKTVTGITYGSDISSYNKDGINYYDPSVDHSVADFVFGGWYLDDSCTEPCDFDTMPEGLVVYAKWVQRQYRVFLHPNVDASDNTLDWGNKDQAMNFRRSAGDGISLPEGKRNDFEFVGWFFDDETFSRPINADVFVCNDTTITAAYNKSTDMTDPMDIWGNGATSNSDATGYNGGDRFWITTKLDLYAQWRAKITGALGIGILYDAGEGTNAPTSDTLKYLDQAKAVAQSASTAPADKVFLYWDVQKWNGSAYVSSGVNVYPGDTFTVKKADAREQEITDGTQTEDVYRTYTIKLLAVYGQQEAPHDTHINFYANNGTGAVEKHENLKVNEAVEVPTPAKYNGGTMEYADHIFLGWAKLPANTSKNGEAAGDIPELSYDDLWLKWVPSENRDNESSYQVRGANNTWIDVTSGQVAADETMPYQDLYAVWAKVFYVYHSGTNVVEKIVINSTAVTETNGTTARTPVTFDLASRTSAGFLYGGYYTDYAGKSANFDAKLVAEASWTAGDAAAAASANARAIYTYTDSGTGVKAYDGTNASWSGAYTDRADTLTPVAGKTYYIKEVPAAKYLRPQLRYTYFENTEGSIANIWLITNLDDDTYIKSGLVIADTIIPGTVTDSLTITPRNKPENAKTHTSQTLFKTAGKLCYLEVMAIDKPQQADLTGDFLQLLQPGQEVLQYWVTPDGMKVTGTVMRAYKGLYTKSEIDLVTNYPQDVESTIVYVGLS